MANKTLVRGLTAPDNAVILSSKEFIGSAFEQMSEISLSLNESTETDEILAGMSDILELAKTILLTMNIKPSHLYDMVEKLSSEEGTFSEMKAVPKEK